jgi:hypothetical protein
MAHNNTNFPLHVPLAMLAVVSGIFSVVVHSLLEAPNAVTVFGAVVATLTVLLGLVNLYPYAMKLKRNGAFTDKAAKD